MIDFGPIVVPPVDIFLLAIGLTAIFLGFKYR